MASTQKRGPARPVERYWRGKPAVAAPASDSESEAEEQLADIKPKLTAAEVAKRDGITILSTGALTAPEPAPKEEESESESDEEVQETRRSTKAAPFRGGDLKAAVSVKKKQESSSEESESEEESSEEEAKPMYKPVFVAKRNRDPKVVAALAALEDPEEEEMKRQEKLEEERRQAHQLVGETLKRSLLQKDASEVFPDVDDTDGIDANEEFESWKLRELQRIKRDADAFKAREEEKAEVEKRRAMPEHLRLKEDLDHAASTRNKERGQQGFLAKYHHRGAFTSHLAEGDDNILDRIYEVGTEDTVRDMASMPKMMQVRDYGKRSRTKHTHLMDVDTTKDDAGWGKSALKQRRAVGYDQPVLDEFGAPVQKTDGCFNCGETGHLKRDCPNPPKPRDNPNFTRANGRVNGRDSDRTQDWSSHNDVRPDRLKGLSDQRQRSRTPPRSYNRNDEYDRGRRSKRSTSRSRSRSRDRSMERMRAERDKRRRVQ